MMKKIPLLLWCLTSACLSVCADDTSMTEVVKVDGTAISNFVSKLTFSGDQVVLNFDDNTTQAYDLSKVSIDFTYGGPTGMSNVSSDKDTADKKVYNLNGQYVGTTTEGLPQGIYITNGKKITVK